MSQPFHRRADGRFFISIIASGLLSFMGVVIETAMNVTFPTLMQEFSITTDTVQWLTTGYLLVLAIIMPISGYLKRRFPMKGLFMAGALFFIAGTLLDALAPTFPFLLLGRMLQGGGTGIALPLMFNIVIEQAPRDRMGLMMGAAMLVCALAPAVGPSVGGFIITHFGWRMIFISLIPLQILALVAGTLAIRQSSDYGPCSFDFPGWLFLAFSFTCFILLCTRLDKFSEEMMEIIILAVCTVVGLSLFVKREMGELKKEAAPLINLHAFRHPSFVCCIFGIAGMQFIVLAIGFLIPSYSQIVDGETAFRAGCILLPGCILGAILAPVSGRIYDWLGAKKPILTGSFLSVITIVLFYMLLPQSDTFLLTCIYMLYTLAQGLSVGNILTYGLSQLPTDLKSDGNAIYNTLQQLSGAIGTAAAAAIVAASQKSSTGFAAATASGTREAFFLLLLIALFQAVMMVMAFKKSK